MCRHCTPIAFAPTFDSGGIGNTVFFNNHGIHLRFLKNLKNTEFCCSFFWQQRPDGVQ